MIFTTHRDGSSLVATWEPRGGRFTLIVDGRVALRARHLRTDKGAQFSWSRHETPELALRVRKLAADLGGGCPGGRRTWGRRSWCDGYTVTAIAASWVGAVVVAV